MNEAISPKGIFIKLQFPSLSYIQGTLSFWRKQIILMIANLFLLTKKPENMVWLCLL